MPADRTRKAKIAGTSDSVSLCVTKKKQAKKLMGYYADIYVIKKSRSKKLGDKFMNHFLPKREESAECYELPRFGDKVDLEFANADKLMEYLEDNPKLEQCIYWRNIDKENPNRHGMIFYTSDSYMIFGISRDNYGIDNTKNEEDCLKKMIEFLKTEEGYITYECPPKSTYSEFMDLAKE